MTTEKKGPASAADDQGRTAGSVAPTIPEPCDACLSSSRVAECDHVDVFEEWAAWARANELLPPDEEEDK